MKTHRRRNLLRTPFLVATLAAWFAGCGALTGSGGSLAHASGGADEVGVRAACPCACADDMLLALAIDPSGPGGGGRGLPARALPGSGLGANAGLPTGPAGMTSGEGAAIPSPALPAPGQAPLAAPLGKRQAFMEGLKGLVGRGTPRPFAVSLPLFPQCALPGPVQDAISKHSIARFAREAQARTKRITFAVRPYVNDDRHFAADAKTAQGLGESIQARSLARMLEFLFPRATVRSEFTPDSVPGVSTTVRLAVRDDAEGYLSKRPPSQTLDDILAETEPLGYVQMALLKSVNATANGIGRPVARGILGIPADRDVVHMYAFSGSPDSSFDVMYFPRNKEFLATLIATRKPAVVFYTGGYKIGENKEVPGTVLQLQALVPEGWKVALLSTLTKADLADGHWLVIDDMRGVMAYLNAAANHVFIFDSVNPLEGLLTGTPTTIVRPLSQARSYNENAYAEALARVAVRSGLANIAQTHEEALTLAAATDARIRATGKPQTPVYLIPDEKGQTALDRFLDHLERVLKQRGL